MIIYLMRHGLAERAVPGKEDATRHLTEQGRSEVTQLAQALAEGLSGLDHLFSSPYLRARQTAELVGAAIGVPVEVDARLAPGCTLHGIEEMHTEYGAPMQFLTVGHQPDVGYLVGALTGRSIAIREGSLIVIEIEAPDLKPDSGVLREVFTPDRAADLADYLRSRQ